jgi:hypothetical protein
MDGLGPGKSIGKTNLSADAGADVRESEMSRDRRVELFRIGRDQAVLIPCEFELPGGHAMLLSHCREKRFSKLILDCCLIDSKARLGDDAVCKFRVAPSAEACIGWPPSS